MNPLVAERQSQPPREVPPLRLQLTHNGGNAQDKTLHIPARGAGMAEALELCGERQNDAQWRLANLCRIKWNADAQRWQLLNNSYTLTCVRNGERVPVACPVPITEGDWLEIGLLRFLVAPADGAWVEDELAQAVAPVPECKTPAERPARAFELRDLADHSDEGSTTPFHRGAAVDPFRVLGMAAAASRPTADVLSELLGESPPPVVRTTPVIAAEKPPAASSAAAPLLDELHDEFVRVVRDPDQLAGRVDWEGLLSSDGESAPTLDELRKQAEPYALLRDILLPREGIDRIIEDFEPLGRSNLLDTEQPEEVLGLFAPELARDARASLPSLTRREHHELSPDSHVRIGSAGVIPGDHGHNHGRKDGQSPDDWKGGPA